MKVVVYIDNSSTLIRSVIRTVFDMAGFKATFTDQAMQAQFCYSDDCQVTDIYRQSSRDWDASANIETLDWKNVPVPDCALAGGQYDDLDYFYTCWFYLKGIPEFEKGVWQDSERRIPGSLSGVKSEAEKPVIDQILGHFKILLASKGLLPAAPWPNGKTWALCLTHDCDRIFRYRTKSHFLDSLDPRRTIAERSRALLKGMFSTFKMAANDPCLTSWKEWIAFEKKLGIPATYFLGVTSRYENIAHREDLHYDSGDPKLIKFLQESNLSDPLELGLHLSINAWRSRDSMQVEVEKFQSAYGNPPLSFRPHYWSLNPDNPESTIAEMSRLGVEGSSSMGMNDLAGFRRRTSVPYLMFESEPQVGLELPPAIMDGSVRDLSKHELQALFDSFSSFAKEANGLLVLDWHSDSVGSILDHQSSESVMAFMESSVEDSSCWIANVKQIVDWRKHGRWIEA